MTKYEIWAKRVAIRKAYQEKRRELLKDLDAEYATQKEELHALCEASGVHNWTPCNGMVGGRYDYESCFYCEATRRIDYDDE